MARRKDHAPEELKSMAIKAVIEFLQEQPADKLSLRQVAKMVGYSPGTLINLFGSYAFLILAANAHTLDHISDQLESSMTISDDPKEQLRLFANAYLTFAVEHPYQWQILFEHHLDEADDIPDWQLNRISRLFSLLESRLKVLNPQSSEEERHKASRVIWAAVHGICTLVIDDKLFAQETLTGESMIQSLLTHYLGSWTLPEMQS